MRGETWVIKCICNTVINVTDCGDNTLKTDHRTTAEGQKCEGVSNGKVIKG